MNWAARVGSAADDAQQRRPWSAVPVAVWRKFQDDQAGLLAALITHYAFLAIFPLLLIFATVLDMTVKSHPELHNDLLNSALAQYPVIGNEIDTNLGMLHGGGPALGFGIAILLFGTRGVAFAMQNALCQVWGIPRDKRPGFPVSWAYGFVLVLVIGFGLVVTSFLSGIVGGGGKLLTGFGALVGAVAISLTANIGVFWVAFRLASMRRVPWRNLRTGAALAAIVWQALQVTGGYVITHELHRASTLYGTFGAVLGLIGWLYVESIITLIAAETDVVLTRRHWPRSARFLPDTMLPGTTGVAVPGLVEWSAAAPAAPAGKHARRKPGIPSRPPAPNPDQPAPTGPIVVGGRVVGGGAGVNGHPGANGTGPGSAGAVPWNARRGSSGPEGARADGTWIGGPVTSGGHGSAGGGGHGSAGGAGVNGRPAASGRLAANGHPGVNGSGAGPAKAAPWDAGQGNPGPGGAGANGHPGRNGYRTGPVSPGPGDGGHGRPVPGDPGANGDRASGDRANGAAAPGGRDGGGTGENVRPRRKG
ncbi:MAG TPA: YihY/virulence factor BrkB family protein [Trebonia sp.]|jgi:YihY family inner membrane protein|nr:YihY/virulence factor BrkB family protein [Trebonia sp.]